jgi:hypothetical protein
MRALNNYLSNEYIGDIGCYGIRFLQGYTLSYMQTNSFFVALFRYLCIVHTKSLQSIGVTPKVLKKNLTSNEFPKFPKVPKFPKNFKFSQNPKFSNLSKN